MNIEYICTDYMQVSHSDRPTGGNVRESGENIGCSCISYNLHIHCIISEGSRHIVANF